MIKDITIGQFFPGDSFVHKLDPRMKLVLTFIYIVAIFLCQNFFSVGLVFALTVLCVLLSRISPRVILKGMKMIFFIILFTSVLQIFYNKTGTTWLDAKYFQITSGGVFTALFVVIRIISLILFSSLLTYTTSPTLLTDAIERLFSFLKIFKIRVHTLAMIMTIALRFIPTLIEEIDKIMSAQKARGADLESGGVIKRAKALIPIFIPLFVNAFRRAYDLALAMECRCYRGSEGRTRMRQMHLAFRDYFALAVTVCVVAAIVFFNIQFGSVL
ncbi:MAG: energy-coupling factor transporter transmembrane protein EcfT [Oscillospiraceae bacterium]|jgi:energy-coupling factor transport system permease protein|nr:energy-coupling factor transporter transmembrane protein EcfT [Oscillospiraceae bacterium]